MAAISDLQTPIEILVDGVDEPLKYANLTINQPIHGHHSFQFLWRLDLQSVLDIASREDMVQKCLGKVINIKMGDHFCKYIITSVEVPGQSVAASGVIVSGSSPTVLIDDIPQNQAYEEANLKQIIEEALADVPGNVLTANANPVSSETFPYIVQYHETDFRFLQRLSMRYGEFMYYNGEELVIGPPQSGGPTLINGIDLNHMHLSAQVNSASFPFTSYDPLTGEDSKDEVSFPSAPGGDLYLSAAADASSQLYRGSGNKQAYVNHTSTKGELEKFKELKEKAYLANLVKFKGKSINPALKPGLIFNADRGHTQGEYIVTAITHYSESDGRYENSFVAIPSSIEVPPYTDPEIVPMGETQTAKVTDNNDPDGMGRVKVAFHWNKGVDSPWLRIVSPHGGGDKGFYFIPEIEEEVQIAFENNNAEKPFVMGTVYHGTAKPTGWGTAANDVKAIKTRSGHLIQLKDEEGKEDILISDKNGNVIHFDTVNKTITISTPDVVNVASKEINIVAEEAVNIAAKEVTIVGKNKVAVGSETIIEEGAPKITMTGEKSVEVSGEMVDVNGQTTTTVKGGQLLLN